MGASTPRSGAKQLPEPEINVTPLVDVVLVLLIIFMVITPALHEGEHVELPEIFKPDTQKRDLDPIDVTMAAGGAVLVDKERVEPTQLESRLVELHEEEPERKLMLNADAGLPYKKIRDTFAMIQAIGFRGVSLKVLQKKANQGA